MSEAVQVSGIVLSAMPIGEYDKRVLLLTKEYGKISAFARGARRPKSALLAAANPFVCGSFSLVPGRNSWTLVGADVKEYFHQLPSRMPGIYYGFYFLELTDWYCREGMDVRETLNLLFLTVKALMNDKLEDRMIRCVFEIRMMTINGDFAWQINFGSNALRYTVEYIARAPLARLYAFTLSEEVLEELEALSRKALNSLLDRRIRSMEILETML